MRTFLLHKVNVLSTGVDGGHKYITAKFEHHGSDNKLIAYFLNNLEENKIQSESKLSVSGNRDFNESEIILRNAVITAFPTSKNWETFLAEKLFSIGATIELSQSNECSYLQAWKNNIYIWCELDKSKLKINKFEFGCYKNLEKPEYKRKPKSLSKGIFANSEKCNIRFVQCSWFGEEGPDFQLEYSIENKNKLMNVLKIPLEIGWIEEDFKIGFDAIYKSKVTVNVNSQILEWSYPILGMGEQDIPLATDKISQWFRTKWGDSFINNKRRHIEKTKVLPMAELNNK